jgi:hypothetical protein
MSEAAAAGHRGHASRGSVHLGPEVTGTGLATVTIAHRVLADLGIEEDVLLWNVVATHRDGGVEPPSDKGRGRRWATVPPRARPSRWAIAVGRLAQAVLGGFYVRHPSHGGVALFRSMLLSALAPSVGR